MVVVIGVLEMSRSHLLAKEEGTGLAACYSRSSDTGGFRAPWRR